MTSPSAHGVGQTVRRALGSHVFVLLVLAVVAGLLIYESRRLLEDERAARERLIQTTDLQGSVLLAQSSVRGFVLGGRSEVLDGYRRAWPAIGDGLRRLRAGATAEQRALLEEADQGLQQWRTTVAEPEIALVRRNDGPAALAMLRRSGGRLIAGVVEQLERSEAIDRDLAGDADHRVDRIGVILAFAIVATSLLAALSALLAMRGLARDIARPLRQLADAAARVGAGEFTARAPVAGLRETQVVAQAFNDMAGRIEHEVAALREVDELKDTFVWSVSHELRTPLTSVRGYLEALLEGEGGELTDEQREYAGIAYRNAGRLEVLISDLLTLSRLESGRAAIEREAISLSELLRDLVEEFRPAAQAKQIELRLDVPDGMQLVADPLRIQQTFGNLLGNAIKFSPPGEPVAMRAVPSSDEVCVEVVDGGPGIPEDELGRIGQRFFRSREAAGVEGTGLGLAISKEIIEQHGGRLEIESRRGSGSTFRVRLPARRAGDGIAPAQATGK